LSEDIIRTILTRRRDLSRETVLDLVARKKAESGGFLSDQGAAILVAQDLNIELERSPLAGIKVKNLVSGLNDVTVKGTVKEVFPLQEFKRQNGSSGKILRFVMSDGTGEVGCAAWDRQADRLSKLQLQGNEVLISHGYTREGLNRRVELSIGDRGEIQITLETPAASEDFTDQFINISEALKRGGVVNLSGLVKNQPRVTEFKRADRSGKVLRTKLMDGTGRITLVAWNEKADDLLNVTAGKAIHIFDGQVRTSINGIPEVHADSMSRIDVLEQPPARLAELRPQTIKISQIKANMRDVDVLARILKVQPPIDVKRNTGETTRVMRLLLGDDTGIIQASLWDDKADLVLKEGETVFIEDATSRERQGEVSISLGKAGAISTISKSEINLEPTPRKLAELPPTGPTIVEGRIVGEPVLRQIQTSKGETVDLAEIQLRDSSGECRVVFWRDLAKQAATLKQDTKVRLFGVYPRLGFKGGVELSSGPITCFKAVGGATPPPQASPRIDKINELKEDVEGTVRATILELSSLSHASPICGKCGAKVEFRDGAATCERCGPTQDIALSATLFLRIDDGSGYIDSIVESPESNALLAQDTKWILRNIAEKKAPRIQLTVETLSRLIGMKVLAQGILTKDQKNGEDIFGIKKLQEIVS